MKDWTATEIKNLRKRLGWSVADFARRFGCKSDVILQWERGDVIPFPAHQRQLESLQSALDQYTNQLKNSAQAQQLIGDFGYDQIHTDEVKKTFEK